MRLEDLMRLLQIKNGLELFCMILASGVCNSKWSSRLYCEPQASIIQQIFEHPYVKTTNSEDSENLLKRKSHIKFPRSRLLVTIGLFHNLCLFSAHQLNPTYVSLMNFTPNKSPSHHHKGAFVDASVVYFKSFDDDERSKIVHSYLGENSVVFTIVMRQRFEFPMNDFRSTKHFHTTSLLSRHFRFSDVAR